MPAYHVLSDAGVIGSTWAGSVERARAKAVAYFRRQSPSLIEDRSSALLDRLLAAGVECSRTIR